jgi:formylglycine-generating enzyme required for sulfatase activity
MWFSMRRHASITVALAIGLIIGVGVGLAWSSRDYLRARGIMLAEIVRPKVLSIDAERELLAGQSFKECADCPEMVIVSAGEFMMGSPADERDRFAKEGPQHKVSLKRFAVARFESTSEEWDACMLLSGCAWPAPEIGFGRGRQPVTNLNWDDARQYVAWLSRRTGKPYRLLSEAEWEYAARGGTQTAYPWGEEIGRNNAVCNGCGSRWDLKQTAPVGSFAPNAFGLHDMLGNVYEWVEDCWHDSYAGAPADGAVWTTGGNCDLRVLRGGSFLDAPISMRSAYRHGPPKGVRNFYIGFRVGRSLAH